MPVIYDKKDEQIPHKNSVFGCVADEEILTRTLYEPEHIKDDVILSAAISLSDLKCQGFSLDRKSYVDTEIVTDRIKTQMARCPDKRQLHTKIHFPCYKVRSICDNNGNVEFVVMDTPTGNNQAHSSLYSINKNTLIADSQLRKKRIPLLELLQEYYS